MYNKSLEINFVYWIYCAHKKIIKVMLFFQPLEWHYLLRMYVLHLETLPKI